MNKMITHEDMYFASLNYSNYMKLEGAIIQTYALRSIHILKDMPQYCYIEIYKARYIPNYIELIRSSHGFKYRMIGSDERDVIDSFEANPDAFWSYYPVCPMHVTIANIPHIGEDIQCFFLNRNGDTSITENNELMLNLDNPIQRFKNTIYILNQNMFTTDHESIDHPMYVHMKSSAIARCFVAFIQEIAPLYSKEKNPKKDIYFGYKIKDSLHISEKDAFHEIYASEADFMKSIPYIQSETEIGKMIKCEDGSYIIVTMKEGD